MAWPLAAGAARRAIAYRSLIGRSSGAYRSIIGEILATAVDGAGAARGATSRGDRESADTRCAPRHSEADGRRAPRPPNNRRRLARALTGTCGPQPAHPGHGRGPDPIRFAGAAARTALTRNGPCVIGARSHRP